MKIEVTQTMIDEGEACSCSGCPVALGIVKSTGTKQVWVEDHRAWIDGNLKNLPDPAVAFIDAFDSGKPVRPFSFELDYP